MNEMEEELAKDQANTLEMAISKILEYCKDRNNSSKIEGIEELKQISMAIQKQEEESETLQEPLLTGEILEGSTNFSYKVYLKHQPNVIIFIKVAFDYARWSPDRSSHYSLDRLTTEFQMLEKCSQLYPTTHAPVAKPYFILDLIPQKVRMLVAEWCSPANVAWAHQFIKGNVDRRIIPKAAEFMALVNIQDYEDPDLNHGIKDTMRGLYPILKGAFGQMIAPPPPPPATTADEGVDDNNKAKEEKEDHFITYAKELGHERFSEIIDGLEANYEKCNVLLHGDYHVLNILVEPENYNTEDGTFESFGELGQFYVCDWEMVHAGEKGRDPGVFCAWPVLSALFLAARGETKKAYDILDCTLAFWEPYAKVLVEKGNKDDQYLLETYRTSLGWCGLYAFVANYFLKAQMNYMPFDLVSKKMGENTMSSVAIFGLKVMEFGFLNVEPAFTIPQLQEWFKTIVSEQIELLYKMFQEEENEREK